ncbi:hypothetical protein P3L10_033128 [Capsicum annuum]
MKGSEETEGSRPGQSDERLIYEQGRESVDVDFCSITIDESSSNNDILQQRLCSAVKQKEELHQMEVGLRAQIIAKSEIMAAIMRIGLIEMKELSKEKKTGGVLMLLHGMEEEVRIFFEREREKQFGKNRSTDHDVGVMLHLVNSELRVILVINQLIMKLGELAI